jgi:predicted GIY-YIG superfamily endonuclease
MSSVALKERRGEGLQMLRELFKNSFFFLLKLYSISRRLKFVMYCVYLIQSINFPDKKYIGYTTNLEESKKHNWGGYEYTTRHRPWELVLSLNFANKGKAMAFEKYLKSGSGNAFRVS